MTRPVRRAAAVAALLLVVGMLVALLHGPRFTTEDAYEANASVRCASAMVVGWPTDASFLQEEDRFDHYSDHVVGQPELSGTQRLGIALDCAERRTTNLAFAVLLGTAAALVGALALSRRSSETTLHR